MLTDQGCAARRERLWGALPSACDLLIVASPEHLIYFAGYVPSPFVFRANESGAVLLMEPHHATLVADDMVAPFVEAAHVDARDTPTWYDGDHAAPDRRALLVHSTLDRLGRMPGGRIGVELASVPSGVVKGLLAARPDAEIVDIGPAIRPLRRAKDPDEVAALRVAMKAGEAAHAAALKQARPGMTELDIYRIVQGAAIETVGRPVIVYGDFASGPRTATDKGGPPSSRVIEAGDLLLLDFSVVVDGYRSDFTNTFAVEGEPTSAQVNLFDTCEAAMRAGEGELKAGNPARAVDEAVRKVFSAAGLLDKFPHHSGHGIGLGHPEPPYFVPESDETIVVGDVVTIEPGLYVEGTGGIRIERNYLITPERFETLSNHEIRIRP